MGGKFRRIAYNNLKPERYGNGVLNMNIEEVMKSCRPVLTTKNKVGDDRCFFEDEINKILYVFGPSSYIRTGFPKQNSSDIEVLEFESGPYIAVGEEVLSGKFAVSIGITYDHDIPLVSIEYAHEPKQKTKSKKRKKNK